MEHQTAPTPAVKDHRGDQVDRPAVLVTGASGGIGRAISQAFGAIGWYVGVHHARHEEAAKQPAPC